MQYKCENNVIEQIDEMSTIYQTFTYYYIEPISF